MPDQMTIVNRALVAELGANAIASLDDNATAAKACKLEYQALVDELLEGFDWNFASRRAASMPPLAVGPTWDFAYAFQLPADCLKVRETSLDEATTGDGDRWAREGSTLLCDRSTVSIRYTARVVEGLWSAAFATAVVLALSARVCFAVTGKENKGQAQEQKAARALSKAKALGGYAGSPRRTTTSALIQVRM